MKSIRDGARTDSMISMLMTYTVNTCVIVAWVVSITHLNRLLNLSRVDATVAMIMYIVMPNNLIFLGTLSFAALDYITQNLTYSLGFYILMSKCMTSPWMTLWARLNSPSVCKCISSIVCISLMFSWLEWSWTDLIHPASMHAPSYVPKRRIYHLLAVLKFQIAATQ